MASSYLVGAPDEASCMRYEIYVIREKREGDDDAREKVAEEETMAVDGGDGNDDDTSSNLLLLAAARSHVAAAVASSPARVRGHLWYRDSLLSSLRASTEEERDEEEEFACLDHLDLDLAFHSSFSSVPLGRARLWGRRRRRVGRGLDAA